MKAINFFRQGIIGKGNDHTGFINPLVIQVM